MSFVPSVLVRYNFSGVWRAEEAAMAKYPVTEGRHAVMAAQFTEAKGGLLGTEAGAERSDLQELKAES